MTVTNRSEAGNKAAIAAVKDEAFSPGQAAARVAEACADLLLKTADGSEEAHEGDTPGLEGFLWDFWTELLRLAEEDMGLHERLASVLAALKVRGDTGCEGWRVWGSGEASWGRLTLFGPVERESMDGEQQPVHLQYSVAVPAESGLLN